MSNLSTSKFIDLSVRFDQLALVICLAFIAQLFISFDFWGAGSRMFPLIPIFEYLPFQYGIVFNQLLFWSFIIALLVTAFLNFKKYSIPVLFVIYFIWLMQDVMRIQAWSYHYLLLLALLWIYHFRKYYPKEILFLMRFVMVMTYLWTGIHKINLHFAEVVFPWLMGIVPVFEKLGDISTLGYLLAIFEILLGIGLLWRKSRKITVVLITIFHLLILILLIIDKWNYVVYPWNLVIIALIWLLFWKKDEETEAKASSIWNFWPAYIVFFLYGIAPGLQPFNLWPYDLCQMMYTGLSTEMRFCFDEKSISLGTLGTCVPHTALRQIDPIGENKWSLNMDDWAMQEFNLPTYPAEWYYKRIGKKLCPCLNGSEGFIELVQKTRWRREDQLTRISCKELLN